MPKPKDNSNSVQDKSSKNVNSNSTKKGQLGDKTSLTGARSDSSKGVKQDKK